MEVVSRQTVFGGTLRFLRNDSRATRTPMVFSIFAPLEAGPFPVLNWLSGLTCSANNFTEKAGAYRVAAELGLIIVAPDTWPRGAGVAVDPAYDLGQGAGFYLDATDAPPAPHFRMESYVTDELIAVAEAEAPASGAPSIVGHSMSGHGALALAMRHPGLYRSVSAFAPIVSPTSCPWGSKAFGAYLLPRRSTLARPRRNHERQECVQDEPDYFWPPLHRGTGTAILQENQERRLTGIRGRIGCPKKRRLAPWGRLLWPPLFLERIHLAASWSPNPRHLCPIDRPDRARRCKLAPAPQGCSLSQVRVVGLAKPHP